MRIRSILVYLLLAAGVGAVFLFVVSEPVTLRANQLEPRQADLANGAALFAIGGCSSCHARPGQTDRLMLGGGRPLPSPFGTFKVPNISPDLTAGIGRWTEVQFANALLSGVGRDNQHLYPAFPYTSYQRMSLNDVRDLFAYLMTLPPDPTPSQSHALPFPFNLRRGVGLWKWLFLDGKAFVPDPGKAAAYNRGAYLVEGPAHCAECHSGRNFLGAIEASKRFAGGADLEGDGWVPNITSHPDGIAEWSSGDVEALLESGFTPSGGLVTGTMADVIENTAKVSATDRAAMAAYLKTLPPRAGRKPAGR